MIEEMGVVISVAAGNAEVEVQRREACGGCTARAACGTSLLDRFLGRRPARLWLANDIGAAVGDAVVLGLPEDQLVKAAAIAYLLPLLGLMLGAGLTPAAGRWLGWLNEDIWSLLGAIGGFALALAALAAVSERLRLERRYQAVLLRLATPAAPRVAPPRP